MFTKTNFQPATEVSAKHNSVNSQLVNPYRTQAKHMCERLQYQNSVNRTLVRALSNYSVFPVKNEGRSVIFTQTVTHLCNK
jgi:regulatory protein YycI of two-component signal transduction system YycFG